MTSSNQRRMFSRVDLVGRVTKQPSRRVTPSGITFYEFDVVTEDAVQGREITIFHSDSHRLLVAERIAELGIKDLIPGDMVYATGSLRSKEQRSRRGNHKWRVVDIIVSHLQRLSSVEEQQQKILNERKGVKDRIDE